MKTSNKTMERHFFELNGVDTTIGFIGGLVGGCLQIISEGFKGLGYIHWSDDLEALLMAGLCGLCGVAGKYVFGKVMRRFKGSKKK